MEEQLNIEALLKKFRQGEASSQELKVLFERLKEENDPEILSLIDREWTETVDEHESAVPDSLLNRIHEKAGIKDNQGNQDRVIAIRRILQYAAIFVLAFLLSWFLKPAAKSPLADSGTQKVNYVKIKVPYGSKTTIELSDSSEVVLNSGSSLEYPDHFGATDRTVFLHGEAYFNIKRNKHKPFYVKTNDATIKVLGTQFNVKSYPDENIMETVLVSGSLEILPNEVTYNVKKHPYKRILLRPNEKAVFMRDAISVSNVKVGAHKSSENRILMATIAFQESEITQKDIAWKSNTLILSNEPLKEIIKKLERWYNVQITLEDKTLGNVRFSARFSDESIADVLHALSYAQPFKYEINKNIISIKTNKP
jgi:ferric-dicitrate binding protein FerR (iron transport regulator)